MLNSLMGVLEDGVALIPTSNKVVANGVVTQSPWARRSERLSVFVILTHPSLISIFIGRLHDSLHLPSKGTKWHPEWSSPALLSWLLLLTVRSQHNQTLLGAPTSPPDADTCPAFPCFSCTAMSNLPRASWLDCEHPQPGAVPYLPWTQGKSTVSGTQQMLSELMRYNPGPGPVGKKVGREEALITALPSCRRGKRMPCYH